MVKDFLKTMKKYYFSIELRGRGFFDFVVYGRVEKGVKKGN